MTVFRKTTSGKFPGPMKNDYGLKLSPFQELDIIYNESAYRLHAVVYCTGGDTQGDHFVTYVLIEQEGVPPELWMVNGMERDKKQFRGHGINITPDKSVPMSQWFPRDFRCQRLFYEISLASYTKVSTTSAGGSAATDGFLAAATASGFGGTNASGADSGGASTGRTSAAASADTDGPPPPPTHHPPAGGPPPADAPLPAKIGEHPIGTIIVEIYHGNILQLSTNVIVNSANCYLSHGEWYRC